MFLNTQRGPDNPLAAAAPGGGDRRRPGRGGQAGAAGSGRDGAAGGHRLGAARGEQPDARRLVRARRDADRQRRHRHDAGSRRSSSRRACAKPTSGSTATTTQRLAAASSTCARSSCTSTAPREAWRALQMQAAASPGSYAVDRADRVRRRGAAAAARLRLSRRRLRLHQRATSGDGRPGESRSPTRSTRSARAPKCARRRRRSRCSASLVRERLERPRTRIPQIGRTLFQLLVPVEIEPFLGGTTEMQLELDAGTAGIPWELLDTELPGSSDRGRGRSAPSCCASCAPTASAPRSSTRTPTRACSSSASRDATRRSIRRCPARAREATAVAASFGRLATGASGFTSSRPALIRPDGDGARARRAHGDQRPDASATGASSTSPATASRRS